MVKKNLEFKLTLKEAYTAVIACHKNADSFLMDFNILWGSNKHDHLTVPLEFALEELGKAIIIMRKIRNCDSKHITLDIEKDRLFDHVFKLKTAVAKLKLYPEEADDLRHHYNPNKDSQNVAFIEDLQDHLLKEIKSNAKQGHILRLNSSFVGFDPRKGKAILEKPVKADLVRIAFSVEKLLNDEGMQLALLVPDRHLDYVEQIDYW